MKYSRYENIGDPLVRAVEECAEFIHMASKVQRFGWFNWNPLYTEKTYNIDLLKSEMGDVIKRFGILYEYMDTLKKEE